MTSTLQRLTTLTATVALVVILGTSFTGHHAPDHTDHHHGPAAQITNAAPPVLTRLDQVRAVQLVTAFAPTYADLQAGRVTTRDRTVITQTATAPLARMLLSLHDEHASPRLTVRAVSVLNNQTPRSGQATVAIVYHDADGVSISEAIVDLTGDSPRIVDLDGLASVS